MKAMFLTNSPAPYREFVHQKVTDFFGEDYLVVYCSGRDALREWDFDRGIYDCVYLKSRSVKFHDRVVYLTSDILDHLKKNDPDVILITGFSIPMIISYLWGKYKNKSIVAFSDANIASESHLSFIHKLVRRVIYKNCDAHVGVSGKTKALYQSYGVDESSFFTSHLCANNSAFIDSGRGFNERKYDVILCGRMVPGKLFCFSVEVLRRVAEKINLTVKVVGDGPEKDNILLMLDESNLEYDFVGFVGQDELSEHYTDSRVFLFPSTRDAWGVVANEALAAGTPVITCPAVGSADELIIHDENGYVLELNVETWSECLLKILQYPSLWSELSENGRKKVSSYTYVNAGQGIIDSINFARTLNEKE